MREEIAGVRSIASLFKILVLAFVAIMVFFIDNSVFAQTSRPSSSQTVPTRHALLERSLRGTLGDYDAEPRRADGRVDIPRLLDQIRTAHMNTYDWLIWHATTDWDDLHEFLPQAAKQGLRVWVTLCPPSEQGSSGSGGNTPRTPEYLRKTLQVTHDKSDGVRIYCLPKEKLTEDPRFAVVAERYGLWSSMQKR